ncbi:hypothetical protein [Herbaspirillum seropedicae]|uniref:hypothetical protein n=1 Tax=Herbaspirillum seropedicae TaxID=964 RepID=UPI003D98EB9A
MFAFVDEACADGDVVAINSAGIDVVDGTALDDGGDAINQAAVDEDVNLNSIKHYRLFKPSQVIQTITPLQKNQKSCKNWSPLPSRIATTFSY